MKSILCTCVISLQHCQHENPVANKGQLIPVRICDSSGKIQLTSLPEYIKTVLQLEKGLFSIQFHRTDAKGKELTRIIHFNDDDFHIHSPTRKEIEFVHELYFSLVTERGKRLKVGFDIEREGKSWQILCKSGSSEW